MSKLCIYGTSVEGPSHIEKNIGCQDANYYEIIETDIGIIAIADGLGSVKHSDIGAKIATEMSVDYVKSHLDKLKPDVTQTENSYHLFFSDLLIKIRNNLMKQSTENGYDLSGLACTLIVVVIIGTRVIVLHIGDGAVVVKTEKYQVLSMPEPSEYANEVFPITQDGWEDHMRICHLDGVNAVAAFTDGCQGALLSKANGIWSAYDNAFESLFTWAESQIDESDAKVQIENFLKNKLAEWSDDKTLVISIISPTE